MFFNPSQFEGDSADIWYNKGKLEDKKNGKDFIFYFSIDIKQTNWLLRQNEQFSVLPTWQNLRSVLQSSAPTPGLPEKLVFQSPCSSEDVLKTES